MPLSAISLAATIFSIRRISFLPRLENELREIELFPEIVLPRRVALELGSMRTPQERQYGGLTVISLRA